MVSDLNEMIATATALKAAIASRAIRPHMCSR
jgi:hypothetical protein